MSDDYEYDDEACPECGAYPTHSRDCDAIGCDDGEIDLYEYDDPINFDPGDTEPCRECFGTGVLHWCPKCGFDFQDPRNRAKVMAARKEMEVG